MPIVPNIATARKYVQITYVSNADTLPNMRRAEAELLKVLGQTTFDAVQARITGNALNALDKMCQEFVVNYAFWEALPDMLTQITDTGLRVPTTSDMPQAFKWQYNEKREKLADAAMMAMDEIIAYLMEHDITEPANGWNSSEHCFMTGKEFAQFYPLQRPHATFQFLKPIIDGVERGVVHDTIGEAFYKDLLGQSFYVQEQDDNYTIMQYLRRAVAGHTIAKAIEQLNCKLSADGLTVTYNRPDTPRNGDLYAPLQQLSLMRHSAAVQGAEYMAKAKAYLDREAKLGGPYASYRNSKYFTDLTLTPTSPNSTRKGVFGM